MSDYSKATIVTDQHLKDYEQSLQTVRVQNVGTVQNVGIVIPMIPFLLDTLPYLIESRWIKFPPCDPTKINTGDSVFTLIIQFSQKEHKFKEEFERIRNAFDESPYRKCFDELLVVSMNIPPEDDRRSCDLSVQIEGCGPDRMFYDMFRDASRIKEVFLAKKITFAILLEIDNFVVCERWLNRLAMEIRSMTATIDWPWMRAAFSKHSPMQSSSKRFFNGAGIYNIADPGFAEFLKNVRREIRPDGSTYDFAISAHITSSTKNRGFEMAHIIQKFQFTAIFDADNTWDPFAPHPAVCFVHGLQTKSEIPQKFAMPSSLLYQHHPKPSRNIIGWLFGY